MSEEKNGARGVGGTREAIETAASDEHAWRQKVAAKHGGKDPMSKDGKVPSLEQLKETHRKDFLKHHSDA